MAVDPERNFVRGKLRAEELVLPSWKNVSDFAGGGLDTASLSSQDARFYLSQLKEAKKSLVLGAGEGLRGQASKYCDSQALSRF